MRLQTIAWLALLGAAAAPAARAQTQQWIQQVGSVDSETIWSSAPDGSGGLYVGGATTGSLGGPNGGSQDAWLARYDSLGNQVWIEQLGASSNEAAIASASDGADGVFVAGFTLGDLAAPNEGSTDVWLARYDGAGNQLWIRQLGTPQHDYVEDAMPDGAGGVFLTGLTYGSLGGSHAGDSDAWLAHYDAMGQQTWIQQWGTQRPNIAKSLAPDGAGGLFVSGHGLRLSGGQGGDLDAWVARYDANGSRIWLEHFGSNAGDFLRSSSPDGAGGVYVTGHSGNGTVTDHDAWLARYDGAGSQLWLRELASAASDFSVSTAPDGAGGVMIAGATYGSLAATNLGDEDAWLASYDPAGNQIWIQQLGTTGRDNIRSAAPDGAGGVFVTGYTDGALAGPGVGGGDAWLARYSNVEASQFCSPAILNSTGQAATLTVFGSSLVSANYLTVVASQLRPFSFGLFLTSPDQGVVTTPAGSQGNLCLGGSIGRYVGPGQVQNSGSAGTIELSLDLTAMPTPTGQVSVQPGDTWNFQAWSRDVNPGPTSNLTDGMSVLFR